MRIILQRKIYDSSSPERINSPVSASVGWRENSRGYSIITPSIPTVNFTVRSPQRRNSRSPRNSPVRRREPTASERRIRRARMTSRQDLRVRQEERAERILQGMSGTGMSVPQRRARSISPRSKILIDKN